MHLKYIYLRIRFQLVTNQMSKSFTYDVILVGHEGEIPVGRPAWSIDFKLNQTLDQSAEKTNIIEFERWAETQKFPILSSFDIEDGLYPAETFKLFADPLKSFGKDLSHYQYLKTQQPESRISTQYDNGVPFDEDISDNKNNITKADEHLSSLFKSKYSQLEKFMCHLLVSDGLNQHKNMLHEISDTRSFYLKKQAN
jgi:hypothetical protein